MSSDRPPVRKMIKDAVEESPLLKFVRDEMQMNANYQPIVIKMLLESNRSEIYNQVADALNSNLKVLNFVIFFIL